MNIFCGIDPGKKGAIAFLKDHIKIYDMPLWDNRIDAKGIGNIFQQECDDFSKCFCIIEKAQSMRKKGVVQGNVSSFTTGEGYGKLLGIMDVYNIEYFEISPRKWKADLKLSKDKQQSINLARILFPNQTFEFEGKRGGLLDGRAEAVLLAWYGRNIRQVENRIRY